MTRKAPRFQALRQGRVSRTGDGSLEAVTAPVNRLQTVRGQPGLIQPTPDAADVHVQAAVVAAMLTLENDAVQVGLGQHLATLHDQLPQQPELQGGQRKILLCNAGTQCLPVQHEGVDS